MHSTGIGFRTFCVFRVQIAAITTTVTLDTSVKQSLARNSETGSYLGSKVSLSYSNSLVIFPHQALSRYVMIAKSIHSVAFGTVGAILNYCNSSCSKTPLVTFEAMRRTFWFELFVDRWQLGVIIMCAMRVI